MSKSVELTFDSAKELFVYEGEHYHSSIHNPGPIKYRHQSVAAGTYRFEERPHPATGTQIDKEGGLTGPWLFIEATSIGASKSWLVSQAVKILQSGATMSQVELAEFKRSELRVGRVVAAELHPNATKLLVLKVDFGEEEPRTIVAGIREKREMDNLLGKKYVFVTNLLPAPLRGVTSQGMILAAKDDANCFALATIDDESIKPGTLLG